MDDSDSIKLAEGLRSVADIVDLTEENIIEFVEMSKRLLGFESDINLKNEVLLSRFINLKALDLFLGLSKELYDSYTKWSSKAAEYQKVIQASSAANYNAVEHPFDRSDSPVSSLSDDSEEGVEVKEGEKAASGNPLGNGVEPLPHVQGGPEVANSLALNKPPRDEEKDVVSPEAQEPAPANPADPIPAPPPPPVNQPPAPPPPPPPVNQPPAPPPPPPPPPPPVNQPPAPPPVNSLPGIPWKKGMGVLAVLGATCLGIAYCTAGKPQFFSPLVDFFKNIGNKIGEAVESYRQR